MIETAFFQNTNTIRLDEMHNPFIAIVYVLVLEFFFIDLVESLFFCVKLGNPFVRDFLTSFRPSAPHIRVHDERLLMNLHIFKQNTFYRVSGCTLSYSSVVCLLLLVPFFVIPISS
jgi:hypothetical protein